MAKSLSTTIARKPRTSRNGNGNGHANGSRITDVLDAVQSEETGTDEDGEEQAPVGSKSNPAVQRITIPELREQVLKVRVLGTAPLMQLRFSEKAISKMKHTQEQGSTAKTKKARDPRNFEQDCELAKHKMKLNGKEVVGIPAAAFRNAMISACRLVNFKMTIAKMSVFVEADGLDTVDGVPLVMLNEDLCSKPEMTVMPVRNANGVADLRARPQWEKWGIDLRIRYDMDQFTRNDVVNLLNRAGHQVGVGEGRPDSRESAGLGFGLFAIESAFVPEDSVEGKKRK